jgi:hypothetical protein
VLDRCKISIDVTGQFLTLKEVLVKHGESDRVGRGVTLADSRRIIAVKVIDRDVRDGGKRIEDHTFLTIGQLDIVVSDSVSGIESEFEPFLELSVKI